MSAPQDTVEAVERHAEHVASCDLPGTAAMLRRLHQRAVDAERERDELQGLLVTHEICADRIKATARADALREAAKAGVAAVNWCREEAETDLRSVREIVESDILALINQPTTTGET